MKKLLFVLLVLGILMATGNLSIPGDQNGSGELKVKLENIVQYAGSRLHIGYK
jgi:hypothetical protein